MIDIDKPLLLSKHISVYLCLLLTESKIWLYLINIFVKFTIFTILLTPHINPHTCVMNEMKHDLVGPNMYSV